MPETQTPTVAPTPNDAAVAAAIAAVQATGTPAPVDAVTDPAVTPQEPATGDPQSAAEGTLTHEQALEALAKARKDAAKYRTQVRELEPLAQAARDAEQAQMSELQREQARVLELTEQLEQSQLQALVATHSIPEEYQVLVTGSTPEARAASAQLVGDLVSKIAATAAPGSAPVAPPTNRPVEGLRPGASPTPPTPPDHSYPAGWVTPTPGSQS